MDTEKRKSTARRLLVHHMTMWGESAGIEISSDCCVEIEMIIDLIFEEITEQVAAVDERRERLAAPRTESPDWDELEGREVYEANSESDPLPAGLNSVRIKQAAESNLV